MVSVEASEYKELIKSRYLSYTMGDSSVIPELGKSKKGKVRDVFFTSENVVMVTNDRVSAFDCVLPSLVPFKGMVLNAISEWAMRSTSDLIPNALRGEPVDPNVVVQKKVTNLGIECIVRGYLWGSMASLYEKGSRSICGLPLEDGMIKFQKLEEPLYTPTTKAEVGADENLTYEEVKEKLGEEMHLKVRELSLALFKRGQELMAERGLLLLDTKYEFGVDEEGNLMVIDEVNTPDSSRMVEVAEYEHKFPKILEEMRRGEFDNVSDLLKKKPEMKIQEFSKQYVRDALLDLGFDPKKFEKNEKNFLLSADQIAECSLRYIKIYEKVLKKKFIFPDLEISEKKVERRMVENMQRKGLIKGVCALIFAGSDSDMPHILKLKNGLQKYQIPSQVRICSAHKQPSALESVLLHYNRSLEPLVILGVAGGTDALSGTASFHSTFPVISCPPEYPQVNMSCLHNPPGSSNAYVLSPSNACRFVAQLFSFSSPEIKIRLEDEKNGKIEKLEKADVDQFSSFCQMGG